MTEGKGQGSRRGLSQRKEKRGGTKGSKLSPEEMEKGSELSPEEMAGGRRFYTKCFEASSLSPDEG